MEKLQGTIDPRGMHTLQENNIETTQNYVLGSKYINGKPQAVRIQAINNFSKGNGVWKMISHQNAR